MDSPDKAFAELVGILKAWMPWRAEPPSVLRDFWMPDQSCRVCYECDAQFTVFNRKHHCRLCGRIFCAKCTANSIPVPSSDPRREWEEREKIRVCNYCFKQWQHGISTFDEGLSAPNIDSSGTPSLESFASSGKSCETSCSSGFTIGSTLSSSLPCSQSPFCFSANPCQASEIDGGSCSHGEEAIDKENHLVQETEFQPQNHHECSWARTEDEDECGIYQFDSEAMPFTEANGYYHHSEFDDTSNADAFKKKVCHDEESVESKSLSSSPLHYSLSSQSLEGIPKLTKQEESDIADECEVPLPSMYATTHGEHDELVDFENNGLLWMPPEPEDVDDERETYFFDDNDDDHGQITGSGGSLFPSNRFGNDELHHRVKLNEEHRKAMKNVLDGYFHALIGQLLEVENVSLDNEDGDGGWLDIITSLCWEAATLLKPDMSKGGGMDPGIYVKVKCIASGLRHESIVVRGVVCKKNVAHRRMTSKIEKPRLLIIGGALEYQRVSNHLSSFDTLLQQEMDHLKMAVAKIDAHHPDVLLVEKSVSRFAQDYLLAKEISLVLNIKRPLLERIARCTGAQVVPSTDHLSSPKLGNCDMFHVERFIEDLVVAGVGQGGKKPIKTLMYFDGCPRPLGFTILLRGAKIDVLKKVKHVVQYGVFAAYHLGLETSFLADEGAFLPELPLNSPITVALPSDPTGFERSFLNVPAFSLPLNGNWHVPPPPPPPAPPSPAGEPLGSKKIDPTSCFTGSSTDEAGFSLSHESEDKTRLGLRNSLKIEIPKIKNDIVFMGSRLNLVTTGRSEDVVASHSLADPTEMGAAQLQPSDLSTEPTSLKAEFPPSHSDHQSILVSLSSRCVWKGTVCERSHLFRIKYYGSFDKPLGRYLRDDLFDQSHNCHFCEMPSEAHVHCYTHRQGTLTISVKKMPEMLLPGEKVGKIWMWHRCLKCPRTNSFPPATRRIVMSDAAWGLSFGKFLELSFSNHAAASRVASCGHSLHRDCLRFYGFGKMVSCFRYASIDVLTVYLPPPKLDFNFVNQDWIQKEMDEVVNRAELLFSEVLNTLGQLCENGNGPGASLPSPPFLKLFDSRKFIAEFEDLLHKEKAEFEDFLQKTMNRGVAEEQKIADILQINMLRKRLLLHSYVWEHRLVFAAKLVSDHLSDAPDCKVTNMGDPDQLQNDAVSVNEIESELAKISGQSNGTDSSETQNPAAAPTGLEEEEDDGEKADDSMAWLRIPFSNMYKSLSENPESLATDNLVYVASFVELELKDGARLLLPAGEENTVIPVFDDEPTSIISYVLTSPDYFLQLNDMAGNAKSEGDANSSLNLCNRPADEASLGSVDVNSDPLARTKGMHVRVGFECDGVTGRVKYVVTCYYAKKFEALRRMCCPSQIDFIRSLSRCKKWGAQGGKSNVFFAKTLDDRFIIKQVTKTELESFIKFAPDYFRYLSESVGSRSPTCLAKILGIFQVTTKQIKGGKESKMDVLVMENLLFRRKVAYLYDLKGSARSRYNSDSSGVNKVLLDQNLIEAMPTCPIFVGNKAKRLLERAVWNDTSFLASIDVMDYSLLVGLDEEKHELILGIIDFMRQYTWDKHLETWVKASGILGGLKKSSPTVISPKQYKKRFRKAMTTYFLMVPDQWSPSPSIIPSKSQSDSLNPNSNDA